MPLWFFFVDWYGGFSVKYCLTKPLFFLLLTTHGDLLKQKTVWLTFEMQGKMKMIVPLL